MSEQSNDKQDLDQDVDLSRRKLAKMGVAAPVIMTLASKPVFGAEQCLSQMMSGNMSQAGDGSCQAGRSYSYWKEPASQLDWGLALGTTDANSAYGVLIDNGDETKCSDYEGGARFKEYFPGSSDNRAMRMLLCNSNHSIGSVSGGGGSAQRQNWIAAYLNSKFLTNYILTLEQVLCFWDGTQSLPPGFTSLDEFFKSTW